MHLITTRYGTLVLPNAQFSNKNLQFLTLEMHTKGGNHFPQYRFDFMQSQTQGVFERRNQISCAFGVKSEKYLCGQQFHRRKSYAENWNCARFA